MVNNLYIVSEMTRKYTMLIQSFCHRICRLKASAHKILSSSSNNISNGQLLPSFSLMFEDFSSRVGSSPGFQDCQFFSHICHNPCADLSAFQETSPSTSPQPKLQPVATEIQGNGWVSGWKYLNINTLRD